MDIFLEVESPDALVRHLFLSFVRYHPHPAPQQQQQQQQKANVDGKTLKVRIESVLFTDKLHRSTKIFCSRKRKKNSIGHLLTYVVLFSCVIRGGNVKSFAKSRLPGQLDLDGLSNELTSVTGISYEDESLGKRNLFFTWTISQ